LNTINEPPAVRSAITDIITNDQVDIRPTPRAHVEKTTHEKGKEFEGYVFYPSKDSMGHDIKYVGDKTVEELKAICDEDPSCLAFNTLGYFKHTIVDESDYISLPSYDGKLHGLYVNMKHWQNMLDGVSDKIMGKKLPVAFVIKHTENIERFKTVMNRFMYHCRDIEVISTWICINMDVDCEAETEIKNSYPFMQFIVQDPDIDAILQHTGTKYVVGIDNDIARRHFSIRDKLEGCISKCYFNDIDPDNPKGPYLTKTMS